MSNLFKVIRVVRVPFLFGKGFWNIKSLLLGFKANLLFVAISDICFMMSLKAFPHHIKPSFLVAQWNIFTFAFFDHNRHFPVTCAIKREQCKRSDIDSILIWVYWMPLLCSSVPDCCWQRSRNMSGLSWAIEKVHCFCFITVGRSQWNV